MAVAKKLEVVHKVWGIDHVTLVTSDDRAAKRFYEQALGPLGFSVLFDWAEGGRVYLGISSELASVWLVRGSDPRRSAVSLAAPDAAAVDAFYAAALAAGAQPISPPASRPEYTPSTYTAEVLDSDGNAVEAVCWDAGPFERAAAVAA